MMKQAWRAAFLLAVCWFLASALARFVVSQSAMEQCQLKHSYDTCFQALNR